MGLNLSAQTSMDYENELCDSSLNMPFSERVKVYPFNRAVSIQFVAYRTSFDDGYETEGMPIQDSVICFEDLLEVKTLTLKQVEYFSDLVVNYNFHPKSNRINIVDDCYDPRNGILFFDVNGKVFEYVDICFDCHHVYGKNYSEPFGNFCSNKFSLILNLFKQVGIEYGITTTEMLKK
jgi:hypothetical protein